MLCGRDSSRQRTKLARTAARSSGRRARSRWTCGLLVLTLAPGGAFACACGCGVFDVAMLPSHAGGAVYLAVEYLDQDQNWIGSSAAPASVNADKEIETLFYTAGFDYQFNGDWGIRVSVPYLDRSLRTDIGTPSQPDVATFRHDALGDTRITARYTGFSPDLSTGVTLGIKLPTGDWTYPNFDRDTSIGTGTTDVLLGAYHVGTVSRAYSLQWFAETLYSWATDSRAGYRPGDQLDAAVGMSYSGLYLHSIPVTPLLQLMGTVRWRDSGINADPDNSGYRRLLLAPGAEVTSGPWKFYADAEFRLYHYANASSTPEGGMQGQLVAPVLIKLMVSYHW